MIGSTTSERSWIAVLLGAALAASGLACGAARESGTDGAAEGESGAVIEEVTPHPEGEAAPTELNAGEAVERAIAPGETHEFLIGVEAGEFFEFRVEQRGMDVELSLVEPGGETILKNDLPIADLGPEGLMAVAERAGTYRIQLLAWEEQDPHGGYLATLVTRRRADDVDRIRSRAAVALYQGEVSAWQGRPREAIAHYERARGLWGETGDDLWQAIASYQEGLARVRLDDLAVATERYQLAADLVAGLEEPQLAVIYANSLAELYFMQGKLERSIESHSAALALRRRSGDRSGEAMTLVSLGRIFKVRGEVQLALDRLERALELFAPEDRQPRATALYELGTVYELLGKHDVAAKRYRAAERLYAEAQLPHQQAYPLSRLGQLLFEAGDAGSALSMLESSLELSRQAGETPSQIATLRRIGSLLLAQDDVEAARRRYLEALELQVGLESPRSRAGILADLGSLNNVLGNGEVALDYHRRSRAIFEEVGDPVRRAAALLGEAESLRQMGRLKDARGPAAEALEISELLRLKPFSEELRLSFFTAAQPFFDFNVDLLMELEAAEPRSGHADAALQVSERARARSLLDLLSEAGAEIRDAAAPELLERERLMQTLLNRNVAVMESEEATEPQRQEADREVDRAVSELDSIRAEIRRKSPRYAELTQPRPLSREEIQRLLDDDTALLEYRLGERSYLWVLTRDAMAYYELGDGAQIDATARHAHRMLMRPNRESEGSAKKLLCALGARLLEPAAEHLERRRLAIVADGALEYIPFAALPDPNSAEKACLDRQPMVVAHEIVHLPSASTLAVLRHEAEGRERPAGKIAVLADPVFSADDQRLGARLAASSQAGPRMASLRDGGSLDAGPLRRLPYSREEAMAILALVPPDTSRGWLGFDASKQVVLSGRLADYRVVHFATHGEFDAEQPALSGIHLSRLDRQGRPVDGSLRAHEIYNLRLPAELVVLSGCETALGKEVRGEGLLGLARGFMYAGASRVMVSLWKVSDRGTAELMQAFYRGLLQQGLAPAAALRNAQLEVRSTKEQPFYWAGFVLQGDWR